MTKKQIKRKIGNKRNLRVVLDYERSRNKANIQEMLELTEMQFDIFKDIVSLLKHHKKALWVKDIITMVSDEGHSKSSVKDMVKRMRRARILDREDRGSPIHFTSGPAETIGHNFAEALNKLWRSL